MLTSLLLGQPNCIKYYGEKHVKWEKCRGSTENLERRMTEGKWWKKWQECRKYLVSHVNDIWTWPSSWWRAPERSSQRDHGIIAGLHFERSLWKFGETPRGGGMGTGAWGFWSRLVADFTTIGAREDARWEGVWGMCEKGEGIRKYKLVVNKVVMGI